MLPAEAEIEEDPLRLRLDFHGESVVLHDYDRGVVRTKLVSALDIAHTLAQELDLDTGLLPADSLWWAKTASGMRVAVWGVPRIWLVRLRERYDAKPRRLRLPMPGLVFVCLPGRQAPYVFAAQKRPHALDDQLYHCPTYNVFTSGRVCTGSHAFPANPAKVPEAFFESYFSVTADTGRGSSQRHLDDIGELWTELKGQPTYPLDDLIPHMPVADAMRIGA
jgi:Prokaryotic E2 family D